MSLYDELWERAQLAEQAQTDPFLLQLDTDERNGLSLIYRVQASPQLIEFLADLRERFPDQYHYPLSDLHVTVLTLIPVRQKRIFSDELVAQLDAVIKPLLPSAPLLTLQGITMTSSAVMIQGFATEDLNLFREQVRSGLAEAGLAEGVDARYKLVGAHVTVLRFQVQPPDFGAIKTYLAEQRAQNIDFGTQFIRSIVLMENDYFMRITKTLARREYCLKT